MCYSGTGNTVGRKKKSGLASSHAGYFSAKATRYSIAQIHAVAIRNISGTGGGQGVTFL